MTYPECTVPATRAERHAVGANSEAADTVLMACEHSHPLSLQRIPDIAGPVIITTKQNTARNRESDGGNTAQNIVVREGVEFAGRTDIEETARCVVRAGGEGVAVGEEPE